jgi:hypothetical protein
MFKRMFPKLTGIGLGLLALALAVPQGSFAASIGMKLASNVAGSTMAAADVAGAPGYTQAYWNNTSNGTGFADINTIKDSDGRIVPDVTFRWASAGTYNALNGTSTNPQDKLNCGFLYTGTGNGKMYFTFENVPYKVYDVVVYLSNDGTDRYSAIDVGNGLSPVFIRNARSANNQGVMTAYTKEAPYYNTLAKAQGDATGYSHVVFKNISGTTLQISHQTFNNHDGIAAVQIIESSSPAAISISNSLSRTTATLGEKVVMFTNVTTATNMVKIDRVDLLVNDVLVQSKKTPADPTIAGSYTNEWFFSESTPNPAGKEYTLKTVAYLSNGTNTSLYQTFTCYEPYSGYAQYQAIPKYTGYKDANGVDIVKNSNSGGDPWGENGWKAFDRDFGNVSGQNGNPKPIFWAADAGSQKMVNFYRIIQMRDWMPNRGGKDFKVFGSNAGSQWTELDSRTGQAYGQVRGYHMANTASNRWYKYEISALVGATEGYAELTELQFMNIQNYVQMLTPDADNVKQGDKFTLTAKISGEFAKMSAVEVRFFSGNLYLGKGVAKGDGTYTFNYTTDRMGAAMIHAQLISPEMIWNSATKTRINVTTVPVEMSEFSAE